jgi:hypothetical protein
MFIAHLVPFTAQKTRTGTVTCLNLQSRKLSLSTTQISNRTVFQMWMATYFELENTTFGYVEGG